MVPTTLMEASNAGSSIDLRTSICAARWKTSSGATSAITRRTAAASAIDSSYSVAPRPRAASRFSLRPVARLSRTATSSPRSSRASTRLEPMKPAPPVTSARMKRARLHAVQRGEPVAQEAQRDLALVLGGHDLGPRQLGSAERRGVPDRRVVDRRRPGRDVDVGLGGVGVPGRHAEARAAAVGVAAELDGDVEVLGPQVHKAGLVRHAGGRAQVLEDAEREPVHLAQIARRVGVDGERLLGDRLVAAGQVEADELGGVLEGRQPPLLDAVAVLDDEAVALDAQLGPVA